MATKSKLTEAKDMAVDAAGSGLDGMKSVAGEALGAAAQAATAVVIERAAEALLNTGHQIEKAAPVMAEAARATAAQPFTSSPAKATPKKKPSRKRAATKSKAR